MLVSTKSAAGKIKTGANEAVGRAVEISGSDHSRMPLLHFNISSARNELDYLVKVGSSRLDSTIGKTKCQFKDTATT
jgi:hypothetical protein